MKGKLVNWSFHWQGRTKQGVNKWTGSVKPLLWMGRIFSIYGPIAGLGGLAALLHGLFTGGMGGGHLPLTLVGLIHGIVFTSIGLWALKMHKFVGGLSRAEEVSARLGVGQAKLSELAEQRNIKPKIILNDQPYYDEADFSDALSLLRAGTRPQDDAEMLMRAAAGTSETEAETLLRAESKSYSPRIEEREETIQSRLGG